MDYSWIKNKQQNRQCLLDMDVQSEISLIKLPAALTLICVAKQN